MAELRHNSLSPYKTRWHTARASRQRTYERAANSNAQARGRQTDALTSGGEVVAPTGRRTDALKSEGVGGGGGVAPTGVDAGGVRARPNQLSYGRRERPVKRVQAQAFTRRSPFSRPPRRSPGRYGLFG